MFKLANFSVVGSIWPFVSRWWFSLMLETRRDEIRYIWPLLEVIRSDWIRTSFSSKLLSKSTHRADSECGIVGQPQSMFQRQLILLAMLTFTAIFSRPGLTRLRSSKAQSSHTQSKVLLWRSVRHMGTFKSGWKTRCKSPSKSNTLHALTGKSALALCSTLGWLLGCKIVCWRTLRCVLLHFIIALVWTEVLDVISFPALMLAWFASAIWIFFLDTAFRHLLVLH